MIKTLASIYATKRCRPSLSVGVCGSVCVCECVHARLMKCVRNSVRIVDRSGVHSTSSHETGTLTHTLTHMEEREASGNLIFSNFHCFRSCLCLPACLFAFYDGNANNNWRKFLPVFFFLFFLSFLANRKLLKCHTDISYSIHTHIVRIYLCVSRLYLSFHTRSEVERQMKNMQMKLLLNFRRGRTHTLLFHLHADEYNLKI